MKISASILTKDEDCEDSRSGSYSGSGSDSESGSGNGEIPGGN